MIAIRILLWSLVAFAIAWSLFATARVEREREAYQKYLESPERQTLHHEGESIPSQVP